MKLLLLLSLTFSITHVLSQERWTVLHNGKEILTATVEDTITNRIILKHDDLKKCRSLRIDYNEAPERKDWNRTIKVYNDAQNEVAAAAGHTLKLRNHRLKKLFKTTNRLLIYTSALPSDPAVAATVRVRCVHLYTLILEE